MELTRNDKLGGHVLEIPHQTGNFMQMVENYSVQIHPGDQRKGPFDLFAEMPEYYEDKKK